MEHREGNIVKLTDGAGNALDYFVILDRGYTGHEHLVGVGLIHMNGRLYDPMLHRFLSPDNYVQDPFSTQNFNRYGYALNNPLMYVDENGEFAFLAIVAIVAGTYAVGNTVAHAIRGDIHNFGDALKYFAQGAVTGAVLGAGIAVSISVPILSSIVKIGGMAYAGAQGVSVVSGLGHGIFTGDWGRLGNAGKLLLGNFYLDENRTFFGAVWQGVSRFTWEMPQTIIGGGYSQLRNTFGGVDRVDFFGGATFATNENSGGEDGISLGNYININIKDQILGDFDQRVISDPLFMHEYGHTFDSQIFGLSYLFAVGIPSAFSASKNQPIDALLSSHDVYWTEIRANRHAARYFGKHFNINWTLFEPPFNDYPRNR